MARDAGVSAPHADFLRGWTRQRSRVGVRVDGIYGIDGREHEVIVRPPHRDSLVSC